MIVTCSVCGKSYEKNSNVNSTMAAAVGRDSSHICYACALERITGGHAPEEGDFNSAHLISGEISDTDLGYLMEDLRYVEEGGGKLRMDYDDESESCPICGGDTKWCDCADRYGDE
jgi:hypothetical protein